MNAVAAIESVLLLGGTSDIGVAVAHRLVVDGARRVILAGRDQEDMAARADSIRAAGAEVVEVVAFDGSKLETHEAFVADVFDRFGDIDAVILAFGVLGDQLHDEADGAAAVSVMRTNFDGAVSVGIPVAQRLRGQGHGHFVVLSSVAAERPRRDNFIYGSSKAGMDAFFQGLADSMEGTGVHVMVVRPGRVRTKMTAGMPEIPFTTDPERVATDIAAGLRRGAVTVWSPPILRAVMFGMRHLPRPLFRRVAERG